jgi:hypothetical protein
VKINCPVHEGCGTTDCEDNGAHMIHWNRLDHHGFRASPPICRDMGLALTLLRALVDGLRILSRETQKGPCGKVSVSILLGSITFGFREYVNWITYTAKGGKLAGSLEFA